MLELFYAPGTAALAVHIALEEAKADYTLRRLDFSQGEQRSADYLRINPKGRVPALVTDRGILTETPAILVYLAQTFPASGLAPVDDPFELARIQAFNMFLCATVHVAHAHKHRGRRWVDDEQALAALTANVPTTMRACFAMLQDEMFEGPWVMGERFSIADPYLFTVSGWLNSDQVDLAEFPAIAAHHDRVRQRPAVERVAPLHGL